MLGFFLFTRNQDGSYNMSLKDFDYGLPEDVIELRRAIKLAKEVNGLYKSFKLPPGQRPLTEFQKSVRLRAINAGVRLHQAFMAAIEADQNGHRTVVNTRLRLMYEAADVMEEFEP